LGSEMLRILFCLVELNAEMMYTCYIIEL
jgi:hypothetical protein